MKLSIAAIIIAALVFQNYGAMIPSRVETDKVELSDIDKQIRKTSKQVNRNLKAIFAHSEQMEAVGSTLESGITENLVGIFNNSELIMDLGGKLSSFDAKTDLHFGTAFDKIDRNSQGLVKTLNATISHDIAVRTLIQALEGALKDEMTKNQDLTSRNLTVSFSS